MARPRGGDWLESEMQALRREGVDILVSLLTSEEMSELGLLQEQEACAAVGICFELFPIPDRDVPHSRIAFNEFVERLYKRARAGAAVVAHCRAGIGRSSLLVAALLMKCGESVDKAFASISDARGLNVPDTAEQVRWLEQG